MNVAERLETLIRAQMPVEAFALENESHMHAGPASESHFKLALVSSEFVGMSKVKRHQRVYGIVAELMQNPIHALALHLYSPEEWAQAAGDIPLSPQCMGGSKK